MERAGFGRLGAAVVLTVAAAAAGASNAAAGGVVTRIHAVGVSTFSAGLFAARAPQGRHDGGEGGEGRPKGGNGDRSKSHEHGDQHGQQGADDGGGNGRLGSPAGLRASFNGLNFV